MAGHMRWAWIIQAHCYWVNRAIRSGQMHDFREISLLSDKWLVHSQKNHGLAYNYADLLLWQDQQNKRSSLFLNGNMICIKYIQNDGLLSSRQFENCDR